MRARALAGLLLAGLVAASAAASAPESDAERARQIFERTKTTKATYAKYAWNWVRDSAGRTTPGGWSAEFHKGSLHRIDVPHTRVVADCEKGTGTAFLVDEGRTVTGPQVAKIACGINTNVVIDRIEWIDRRETRFGPVDRIRVIDEKADSSYAVTEAGVLVAAESFSNRPESKYCVQNEAVAVETDLPSGDIFSTESLNRSVVPEKYHQAPAAPGARLWLEGFKCD